MAKRKSVAVLVLAVTLSVAAGLWASVEFGEAGVLPPTLIRQGFMTNVARDGVASAEPPPAYQPRLQDRMRILVDMVMSQPAVTASGNTPLRFRGSAEGVVMKGSGPTTYHGSAMIDAHEAGYCRWALAGFPVLSLDVVVSRETTLIPPRTQYFLKFNGPSWHYDVTCGEPPPIRFPAGAVDESLPGWLGLILAGQVGPDGLACEMPEYSGEQPNDDEVIYRRGTVTGTNEWGTVTITIDIFGSR